MTAISSAALSAAPRLGVAQAQAALARVQAELSSGKLADIGVGLGAATGTYVSLGAQVSQLQALKTSNGTASTTLGAASAGLDTLRTAASAFLSSLTTAASAGSTPGALVATAGANLAALTSTLNTTVGGAAVFAGINTAVAPMTAYGATGGSPPTAKDRVDASFSSAFGTSQSSAAAGSISGSAMQGYLGGAFADLFSPSGYAGTWSSASDAAPTVQVSPGETVATSVSANAQPFRQLAQAYTMVKEFGGANFGSDASKAVLASAAQLVSSAIGGLTSAEAGVGQAQAAVSDADGRMTAQISYLSARSGDMVGVDAATLSTEITGLQTRIQASYEITAQLQQLSLVNYLK